MKHSMKLALVLALALGGCGKEEPKTEEAPAEQPAEAPEVAAEEEAAPAPELSPEEPSTEVEGAAVAEDFEEEAARTVKLENVDAELDRLEAEIVDEEG